MNDPRGSIFRIWDIHVHTPESVLNPFGGEWDTYVTDLISAAIERSIAVIGVTDYFTIEGYKRLRRDYLDDPGHLAALVGEEMAAAAQDLTFLPCIEFRVPPIIDGGEKVDLHVLFSPDVEIDDIEQNFLHQLKYRYASQPQSAEERHALTLDNLRRLGGRLKAEHSQFEGNDDLFVGMMNAVVDDDLISEVLSGQPAFFQNKYLIGVAADEALSRINWDSGAHQVRKLLIQGCDFLLSSNPNTVEFGLGLKSSTPEDFVAEFGGLKPCLWGSDAHSTDRLFVPDNDRYLWIKADTTFEGLRQALRGPARRVSICAEPDECRRTRGAEGGHFIDTVFIRNTDPLPGNEKWFEQVEIPMNAGMVAIIGNRGSGKSALTDLIGLVGSTPNHTFFSFLSNKAFRKRPERKADHFEAQLLWADGSFSPSCPLGENPDITTPERVKYIPQNFLEHLCASTEYDPFEKELGRVIFDFVPEEDRHGASSLEELIAALTASHERFIERLKEKIAARNSEILDLEKRLSPDSIGTIKEERDLVRQQIIAHYESRPILDIPEAHESSETNEKLRKVVAEKKAMDEVIAQLKESSATMARQTTSLDNFLGDIDRLEGEYKALREAHSSNLRKLGLEFEAVVKLDIDREALKLKRAEIVSERSNIMDKLDSENEESDAFRLGQFEHQIELFSEELEGPARLLEENRRTVSTWRKRLEELIGDAETPGSLEALNRTLTYLGKVAPVHLSRLRRLRVDLSAKILGHKQAILETQRQLYQPVLDAIESAIQTAEAEFEISIRSNLRAFDVVETLLGYIARSASGFFYGTSNSQVRMTDLVEDTDWNRADSVGGFLEGLIAKLENRDGDEPGLISKQIRQGNQKEFYGALFFLDYVKPTFELNLAGKDLRTLSPGERGALLLVFYLMIDKGTTPLVIDQPEENLDNESVVRWMVGFLDRARKRRQVILVTHNPNIAVVADADQVIYASIDRENGNAVKYTTGSIENPPINLHVVDVLEGTLPAFRDRDRKYEVTKTAADLG